MPGQPYVSTAEFIAYPQYLDLKGLITGGSDQANANELTNVLLRASALVDSYCHQALGAHIAVRSRTATVQRDFTALLAITDRPFVAWQSVSVSSLPFGAAATLDADAIAAAFPDQDGALWRIPLAATPYGMPGGRVNITGRYVAGYANTVLAADAEQGATEITVADPLGLLPGATTRLWAPVVDEDGGEETLTVADTYTPGSTTVTLANPLLLDHKAGAALSAMPADLHEAVILWAMSLLMRPSSGGSDDPFSDAADTPTTSEKSPRRTGRGFLAEAKKILCDGGYRRPM